jgi:hypothetical protein
MALFIKEKETTYEKLQNAISEDVWWNIDV